jgi:signal transduction histidine kinase/ActR/RegA family two-component response regulator
LLFGDKRDPVKKELWNPQTGFPLALRVTASFALVGLSTVGAFSTRSFDEQRRQRFLAERQAKAAQLALTAEKERAVETARARTAFLAAMSHEFRNPISAVVGLSELLLAAPPGAVFDREYRKQVRTIRESAQALLTMLNDILDLAKIDAQKLTLSPVPFDLHRLLQSVVEMMKPTAHARAIGLVLTLPAQVPQHVVGDDIRLRQVLVNLIANGIKFTEWGEVCLQVTADLPEPGHAQLTFHVTDTGKGMTPEVLARLFRPFEQAEAGISRRYGGTGLGLSISKQLVVAMDGDIQVQSVAGKGSDFSFTIRLPVGEPSQDPSLLALPAPVQSEAVLRLLLVDDNAINRLVASKLLRQLGHEVHVASNGEEAITAVLQSQFDVVLMDLQMPKMDGIEATLAIRDGLHGTRLPFIIAMTASSIAEDRDACLQAGMCDFICKPMNLKDISVLLARLARESSRSLVGTPQSTGVDSGP